jgi:hypothetical protein
MILIPEPPKFMTTGERMPEIFRTNWEKKPIVFQYFVVFYTEAMRRFQTFSSTKEFLAFIVQISSIHCTNEALPSCYSQKCDCR